MDNCNDIAKLGTVRANATWDEISSVTQQGIAKLHESIVKKGQFNIGASADFEKTMTQKQEKSPSKETVEKLLLHINYASKYLQFYKDGLGALDFDLTQKHMAEARKIAAGILGDVI